MAMTIEIIEDTITGPFDQGVKCITTGSQDPQYILPNTSIPASNHAGEMIIQNAYTLAQVVEQLGNYISWPPLVP